MGLFTLRVPSAGSFALALQDGGAVEGVAAEDGEGNLVVSPNGELVMANANFTPTETGKILFAVVLLPVSTGRYNIDVSLSIASSTAANVCSAALGVVDPGEAITGGTQVGDTAIVLRPTSITPAESTGLVLFAAGGNTVVQGSQNNVSFAFAGVPYQATPGQAFILYMQCVSVDTNAAVWSVGGTINIREET